MIPVHSVDLLVRNQLSCATLEMTGRYIKRTLRVLADAPEARRGNVKFDHFLNFNTQCTIRVEVLP
jgi:hypothetical protein